VMYSVIFSDKSRKQFLKLEKGVQERIVCVLERIKLRPEAFITKLVGDEGYKFRVVDYRIILDIDKGRLLILVIKIRHRKNVYD